MRKVRLDDSYNLNMLGSKKAFDVVAVVSAYNFTKKPPYFVPRWEKYNFSQMMLVLEGEGKYITEDAEYDISPGKMFYRPPYKSSLYKWDTEEVRYALISFVCDSEAMSVFSGEPISLFEEEQAVLLDAIKTGARICEPLHKNGPAKKNAHLRGMRFKEGVPDVVLGFISSSFERFLSMVYCRISNIELLCDESQKANMYIGNTEFINRVTEYMTAHLSEWLTLGEICSQFGISQAGLTRKFRRECGKSVMEYFAHLKIGEAKHRIEKTTQSFAEIAESLGFSTSNYFSKVFKKCTGMSPTQYSKFVSKRRSIK